MKKLFILAAAIVAFASCSKNEPEATVVPTREIQFATAAQTRADMTVVDVDYLEDNGFVVYGYAANEAIFTKTEVLYAEDNALATTATWAPKTAGDVKYWASGVNYVFSAYAPKDANISYSFTADNVKKIDSYTNDGVTDLVVSDKQTAFQLTTTGEGNAATATPVGLYFNHMLSRVKFSFENAFADTDVKINITGVKIVGVGATGSATFNENDKPVWAISTSGDFDYDQIAQLNATDKKLVETVYRTIIPATAAYKVEFTIEAVADRKTFATIAYTDDNAVALPSTEFVAGKSYDFKAFINVDKVGKVYPIEFSVDVKDWDDTTPETVIPGFADPNATQGN